MGNSGSIPSPRDACDECQVCARLPLLAVRLAFSQAIQYLPVVTPSLSQYEGDSCGVQLAAGST